MAIWYKYRSIITSTAIAIALALCVAAAFAQGVEPPTVPVTTPVPASSFQIDISPIITALLQAAGVALIGMLGWVSVWAKQYFKNKSAGLVVGLVDDALGKSLTIGLQSADAAIRAKGWDDISVKNQTIATAANYMITNFPDKVKAMGLDPTAPATVTTLAAGALNRAFPQAATLAAASPTTPPAPPTPVAPVAARPAAPAAPFTPPIAPPAATKVG